MNNQVISRENEKRVIAYCYAAKGNDRETQRQVDKISDYVKKNGLSVCVTFRANARMDGFTYRNLRLRATYREFDILLVPELDSLGNSPIEVTQEVNFLNANGVIVISLKDGELNSTTLPILFRKMFRIVGHNS